MNPTLRALASIYSGFTGVMLALVMVLWSTLWTVDKLQGCGLTAVLQSQHPICIPAPWDLILSLLVFPFGLLLVLAHFVLFQRNLTTYELLFDRSPRLGRGSPTPSLLSYSPEAIVNDAPFVRSPDPSFQCEVLDGNVFRGHAVRIRDGDSDLLICPAHVLKGVHHLTFRRSEQSVTCIPNWTFVQDDVCVAPFPRNLTPLGMKAGRPAKTTQKNRATITSRGTASVGSLVALGQRQGYFSFDANSQPGFSGAALVREHSDVFSIHLGYVSATKKQLSFSVDLALVLYQNNMTLPHATDTFTYCAEAFYTPETPHHEDEDFEVLEFDNGANIRMSGGRYTFVGADLLEDKVEKENRLREERFERDLQHSFDAAEKLMSEKGWTLTDKDRARITKNQHGKIPADYLPESAVQPTEAATSKITFTVASAEPSDLQQTKVIPPTLHTVDTRGTQTARINVGSKKTPNMVQCCEAMHVLSCEECRTDYNRANSYYNKLKNVVTDSPTRTTYKAEALGHTSDSPPEHGSFLDQHRQTNLSPEVIRKLLLLVDADPSPSLAGGDGSHTPSESGSEGQLGTSSRRRRNGRRRNTPSQTAPQKQNAPHSSSIGQNT